MIPDIAKTGSSFKGALAYYLHDKKLDGERERSTAERVAWTETRNLITRSPELAGRIMAATAMDAARLKADAGVKNTGRKSDQVVYAYTLAWHPEEAKTLTRSEMVRAADETLRVLGADDRQAILVCHTDRAHPHVHVIVNRVSPKDGRMLGTGNDRLKLSQWALAYREMRGQNQYCPQRAENWAMRLSRHDPANLKYWRASADMPRAVAAAVKAATAAKDERAPKIVSEHKVKAAALSQRGAEMNARHAAQWKALGKEDAERRSYIKASTENSIRDIIFSVKASFRPQWQELGRRHTAERKAHQERETRVLGKIRNAIAAVTHARQINAGSSRGFVTNAFNYLIHAPSRTKLFDAKLDREAKSLAVAQNVELKRAIGSIRRERAALLDTAERTHLGDRAALSARQAAERGEIKAQWRQLAKMRALAFETSRRTAENRAEVRASRHADTPDAKDAFNAAAEGRTPGRTGGLRRTRSRKR